MAISACSITNHEQYHHHLRMYNIIGFYYTFIVTLILLPFITISDHLSYQQLMKCGTMDVPFPFFVNRPSNSSPAAFRLSCNQWKNSSYPSLFLSLNNNNNNNDTSNYGSEMSYQVLQFFPDGILVDYPDTVSVTTSSCRRYYNLSLFDFEGDNYFAISADNVFSLYDCQDTSSCKLPDYNESTISTVLVPACNHITSDNLSDACCYRLSGHRSRNLGDKLSVFSQQFGCRGFSSWVGTSSSLESVSSNSSTGMCGVKLEWAFPAAFAATSNSGGASPTLCAPDAYIVNATSITSGIRCKCEDGFFGDGFAQGDGCFKSSLKDGKDAYASDSHKKRHGMNKLEVMAGVLIASAFVIASLTAVFCLLRRPPVSGTFHSHSSPYGQRVISFQKAYRTKLLTFHELEEATKGFDDCQKLVDSTNGIKLYAGVLANGSSVIVHKIRCDGNIDLIQILSQVELLAAVSHRNMARLLGCSIDSENTPLVVYEYPVNGSLSQQLHRSREQKIGLVDWYKRLSIATETANVLTFLQYEISPPILHHDLQSGCILLDEDFSVKIAGFELLMTASNGVGVRSHSCDKSELGLHNINHTSDVYNFGLVLLEIIEGAATSSNLPTIALQKIRSGKLEEIVDPLLYYHEQPVFRREQIEKVADLATRCLLFGGDGKLGMVDAARELQHIAQDDTGRGGSRRGPALEVTFSNSSLLQMMSMSPDTIYVP